MSLISGIHHVALKCHTKEEFEKVISFYTEVLELPVKRQWDAGIMFDTGCGLIEVFNNGVDQLPQGVIRHFALAVSDVDALVSRVRDAGYEVYIEPKDIVIQSDPPLPARIAFVFGPIGEEIEFFCEK